MLAERAGVPAGAFSVVTTTDSRSFGTEICKNPTVAKISFTGSTSVGRWLMREAADTVTRLSLELGGNAPFIVFDDADLDAAVEGALLSKFRNAGQTCVCANRIYVQAGIHDAFVERLLARVGTLKLGRGQRARGHHGAADRHGGGGEDGGARRGRARPGRHLRTGGRRAALGSTFFEPTVVTGVTREMLVTREETFAPLAPVIRFETEAEAIAMANATEFGLAAYFYARDMARVLRVPRRCSRAWSGSTPPRSPTRWRRSGA